MLKQRKIRDQKGAAVTWLVLCLMLFILMSGLFAFDASRVQMAQRELTATCDAAALAGTAMLTSYDVSNDTGPPVSTLPAGKKLLDAQNNSGAYAYNMFLMGNVLGQFVRPQTQLVSNLSELSTTVDGQTKVCIGLVDPQNGYSSVAPVIPGNAAGTAIGVYAGYGYHPAFISLFGVGNVGIRASSVGGLPQVDAVLVLDLSGSMDDLTPVTLVKRYWDAHRGATFGEPLPATGYNGSNPDSLGWCDDSITARGYINTMIGGPTPAYPTQADFETLPAGDIGSQPRWASLVNGSPEKTGIPDNVLDFGEFSGHGCVTYLEAPHPNNNQSIIEYMGLDTATYLTGTSLNALPPQNLQFSEKGTVLTGNRTLVFKPFLRHSPDIGSTVHVKGNDFNSPPGNCPLLRLQGGQVQRMCDLGWVVAPGPGDPPTVRCSPYKNYLTDHIHYPPAPASGMIGNAPINFNELAGPSHGVIFTDLVVNFGNPGNAQRPVQPAWGPNIFQPVSYTFGGSDIEDDTVIQNRSYSFPNIAVVVEAARGNLDTPGLTGGNNFNNTGLHRGYHLLGGEPSHQKFYTGNVAGMNSDGGLVQPQVGYQRAYQRLAMWYSQPIATTLDSCDQAFFQRLTALTDCRFGLIGFSDRWTISGNPKTSVSSANTGQFGSTAYYTSSGPSANSFYHDIGYQGNVNNGPSRVWDGRLAASTAACAVQHECKVDQASGGGGGQGIGFRLPRFALNSGLTKAQCLRTMQKGDATSTFAWSDPNHGNGLYNGRPLNGTMCSEALETARLSFSGAPYTGAQRAGSKRAIIFFTDGVPVPDSEAGPSGTTADSCKNDGIAIFSIGLNMLGNGDLTSAQTTFLGNGAGGLSGRAKNGGRFFMCNDVVQVQQAFSSIARRLTQSQK
jgi:hypothetical protein